MDRVPAAAARRLLMEGQGLLLDPSRRATARTVHGLVEKLGFVQLDTITVIERAHHHILATRLDAYSARLLDQLHASGRLFEHFTHDASLIPSPWFPHWRYRFERSFTSKWWEERIASARPMVEHVLERIRREGPLGSKDFEEEEPARRGGWWDWRPAKAALEYLWRTGTLAVAKRVQFQKLYDLTERVLPVESALPRPSQEEHVDWACRTALLRLGVATPTELAHFWHAIAPAQARAWCAAAVRRGDAVPVRVESEDGSAPRAGFAIPDWKDRVATAPDAPGLLRLLSPFDPVIRDRARAMRLFNFDYSFEAFVPAAKRKYGYYVLPILEGDRLIGRLDPKLHRSASHFEVQALWWEPGVRVTKKRRVELESAVERFASWLGARRWSLPRRAR